MTVEKKFLQYIYRHASLILLAGFSVCYFFAIILARKTFDAEDFYIWSALATVITMAFTFCFLGAEQLFVRFSTVDGKNVLINWGTIMSMILGFILFVIAIAVLSELYFFRIGAYWPYIIISLAVAVFVGLYNFKRLTAAFLVSQVFANGWKLVLLLCVIVFPFAEPALIVLGALAISTILSIGLFAVQSGRLIISFEAMPEGWLQLQFSFFLSLLTLLLLGNLDRLMITRFISAAAFSNYFYLVTLLIQPFGLLSNYFGFREAAMLKRHFSRRAFQRKLQIIFALSAVSYAAWFAALFAARDFLKLPVHYEYFFACSTIVICRNIYALMSALVGMRGSARQILTSNLITILFVPFAVAATILAGVSIGNVLTMIAMLWILRVSLFFFSTLQIAAESTRKQMPSYKTTE
jgi:O-antigen/teichoic acid export membrane protein